MYNLIKKQNHTCKEGPQIIKTSYSFLIYEMTQLFYQLENFTFTQRGQGG